MSYTRNKPKSINRKQKRDLAKLATRGEKQIRKEQQEQFSEEKKAFLSLPFHKRLKYFYDSIPTKLAKRTFWVLLPIISAMVLVYGIINVLKLDIAWSWSSQIFHTIKK